MTRDERRVLFGGGTQGGVEPSRKFPAVFVYSDPGRGGLFGYDFDGWDTAGDVFLYTGEGQRGDQRPVSGNRALLTAADRGRALHVFVADGRLPGTLTVNQLYLGQFQLDPEQPYVRAEAPDVTGEARSVLVFRLRPIGGVLTRDADRSAAGAPAGEAQQVEVALTGAASDIPIEAYNTSTYERRGSESTQGQRTEGALLARYQRWVEKQGHLVTRHRLRPPGELQWLLTDLHDVTANELYEAKGVSTRASVRAALAQLLDYRRHLPAPASRCTALLPVRPSDDLVALLRENGLGCVYETITGHFERA